MDKKDLNQLINGMAAAGLSIFAAVSATYWYYPMSRSVLATGFVAIGTGGIVLLISLITILRD